MKSTGTGNKQMISLNSWLEVWIYSGYQVSPHAFTGEVSSSADIKLAVTTI